MTRRKRRKSELFFGGVAKTSQLKSTFGLGAAAVLHLPDLTLTVQHGAG